MNLDFLDKIEYMRILALCGEYALKFVISLIIFFVGKWLAEKITQVFEKIVSKTKIDKMLSVFLVNAVKTMLLIFVIIAALSNLGIETTSFVAVLGAMGLAVGMAFKDTFGNIGAGVLIIFFKPFRLGDFVEIGGMSGFVRELNLFSTYIVTRDFRTIIIPNSQVIAAKIINYSLQNKRRVDLVFSIDYGDDIRKARSIILDLAAKNPLILTGERNSAEKPFVGVLTLNDSSVDLAARFWVRTEDYWSVYHGMLEAVKYAFDENGITIPFPQVVEHRSYIGENNAKTLPAV